MHLGVDLEQFVCDPYGSGIQRVLQYIARSWPHDAATADFVVPYRGRHALLSAQQAFEVVSVAFEPMPPEADLRRRVATCIEAFDPVVVRAGELLALFDAWLLPEVSYLPTVLERFELLQRCIPTAMIGYDALPMTEPANYRFKPGASAWVSEYFRRLATADAVICISDYSRDSILGRLRRDPARVTTVASPGGDHVAVCAGRPPHRPRFVRLGTLEARKHPREILAGFRRAAARGLDAELVFIGSASASDAAINADVAQATREGIGVTWIEGASDAEVREHVSAASAFLSIGVEGYGIPVLEAIRWGTPVLFDGIQPAAELMLGRGAHRIEAMSEEGMAQAFLHWSSTEALDGLRAELDPAGVPTWAEFTHRLVAAIPVV